MIRVLASSAVDRGFIGGVMIRVLASSALDRGLQSQSGQTKGYEIDICCFSTKQVSIRSKTKDCLTRNQNNVSS